VGLLEYETVGEFLADIRKEFGGEDEESVKVTELRKLGQEEKTIEEFVQKLRRAARGSKYEREPLCYETLWTWTIFIFFFFYFLTL